MSFTEKPNREEFTDGLNYYVPSPDGILAVSYQEHTEYFDRAEKEWEREQKKNLESSALLDELLSEPETESTIPEESKLRKDNPLVTYARSELKRAGLFDKDADYNGQLAEDIMKTVELMVTFEHSGAERTRFLEILSRVAKYRPLTPLTYLADEWVLVDEKEDIYQNIRDSYCFKRGWNGLPYFIIEVVQGG